MRDYIKNSKQVDMFLGSIDPVIIEFVLLFTARKNP